MPKKGSKKGSKGKDDGDGDRFVGGLTTQQIQANHALCQASREQVASLHKLQNTVAKIGMYEMSPEEKTAKIAEVKKLYTEYTEKYGTPYGIFMPRGI